MTIASALDHLTDVLANRDVAGYQTIEQSIGKIADMIEDGEISLGGDLQPATADTLGGVKIGDGVSVTSDGTISASGASSLIVNDVSGTLDKTWQEIYDAASGGSFVVVNADWGELGYVSRPLFEVGFEEDAYIVAAGDNYISETANGYPAVS